MRNQHSNGCSSTPVCCTTASSPDARAPHRFPRVLRRLPFDLATLRRSCWLGPVRPGSSPVPVNLPYARPLTRPPSRTGYKYTSLLPLCALATALISSLHCPRQDAVLSSSQCSLSKGHLSCPLHSHHPTLAELPSTAVLPNSVSPQSLRLPPLSFITIPPSPTNFFSPPIPLWSSRALNLLSRQAFPGCAALLLFCLTFNPPCLIAVLVEIAGAVASLRLILF